MGLFHTGVMVGGINRDRAFLAAKSYAGAGPTLIGGEYSDRLAGAVLGGWPSLLAPILFACAALAAFAVDSANSYADARGATRSKGIRRRGSGGSTFVGVDGF